MTAQTDLFYRFGVALFIGILVGLQREYASEQFSDDERSTGMFAGVRTFPLMALVGCAAAMIAELLGSAWAFVGIIAPLGVLIAIGYFVTAWRTDAGMTTEVAAVLTTLAGALCYWQEIALAVALGVTTMVLLSLKIELRRFAETLTRQDILAIVKFAVITAIVLPVLPDRAFGEPPFDVLNPYNIWLFIVLISGISFLGYVLMRIVDPRRGITLTGVLGGLASSTATTLSFSQRSQQNQAFAKPFALAVVLAWTVMFGRTLVEIGTINRALLGFVWAPMLVTASAGIVYAGYLYFFASSEAAEVEREEVSLSNPFELRPAITFGLIFTVVLLISSAGQYLFGTAGLYISSFVSGLADVDAVALSMAELSQDGGTLSRPVAAQAVVIAALANTISKGAIVFITGSQRMRRAILPGLILMLVVGTLSLLLL
jgi:uncharacterized membrane protein (DUF4010 family)